MVAFFVCYTVVENSMQRNRKMKDSLYSLILEFLI